MSTNSSTYKYHKMSNVLFIYLFRSYYFCEVPRTSIELTPQIFKRNQDDIQILKTVLGASDMLINID